MSALDSIHWIDLYLLWSIDFKSHGMFSGYFSGTVIHNDVSFKVMVKKSCRHENKYCCCLNNFYSMMIYSISKIIVLSAKFENISVSENPFFKKVIYPFSACSKLPFIWLFIDFTFRSFSESFRSFLEEPLFSCFFFPKPLNDSLFDYFNYTQIKFLFFYLNKCTIFMVFFYKT